MIPSIEWTDENKVKMIDQTLLPHDLKFLEFENFRDVATSIKVMNIRGAPAIGVAAAMGMALASLEYNELPKEQFLESMEQAAKIIKETRPTASNLFWAVNRIWKILSEYPDNPKNLSKLIIEEAKLMAQEDITVNKNIGK
ncbi:MAG: S-methyl-5-thioribose-1-phosphate isomerase, partial [Promethearchaeota archaeon]